jgi:hypothetical protein
LDWPQLLESRRILLIAEAGAGKTHECREQARKLFEQGEAAFFLRLEEVAAKGIVAGLYGEKRRRFDAWRASASQRGFFFLDSVDELQLAHADFRDALDRVAHDLEGAEARATILVTSRPVDIDRRAFSELLRPPVQFVADAGGEEFVRIAVHGTWSDGNDSPPDIREVSLEPLSDEQIIEFARSQSVTSPDALLAAIHARHAGDFARRPQDLIELCDNWRDYGEIRSHFEQVRSHVRARLVARHDRKEKADLTEERARDGAQRLALSAILSRQLTIRYSAGADVEGSGDAPLVPGVLLADWGTAPEIAALLERPIFAEAGYGRGSLPPPLGLRVSCCEPDRRFDQVGHAGAICGEANALQLVRRSDIADETVDEARGRLAGVAAPRYLRRHAGSRAQHLAPARRS